LKCSIFAFRNILFSNGFFYSLDGLCFERLVKERRSGQFCSQNEQITEKRFENEIGELVAEVTGVTFFNFFIFTCLSLVCFVC